MQCIVFDIGNNKIIKIYSKVIKKENIIRLKDFYSSLNLEKVSFITPLIDHILEINNFIFVEEKKLPGFCPNFLYVNSLNTSKIELFLHNYVHTLFKIKDINTNYLNNAEPLDLSNQFFVYKKYSSWNELLTFNICNKYLQTKSLFDKSVKLISSKKIKLLNFISKIKMNPSLMHGDYCFSNLLINKNFEITSIFDFGILTTIGDPLFDIATGWAFSDMYGQIKKIQIKDFTKHLIFERLSKKETTIFYSYVLSYSFISANMYKTNDPQNEHFKWCINNLNNDEYWKNV